MRKLKKLANTCLLLAAVMLLFSTTIPSAYATSSVNRQVSPEQVVQVDFSEGSQPLELINGKNYLISCPVTGEGWQISEIHLGIKGGKWLLLDGDMENKYISVEKCQQNEPGKVQMFIHCKSTNLVGLKVGLENKITGEKKGYSFTLTVSLAQPTGSHFVVWYPSSDDGNSSPSTPPSGGTDEKPLIVIDTTGWSFDSITTVYDGNEYTVEVTGLPDYVTPVYTNNTRTNAGTSTAHVSFLVPEGYATPESMETTITIEKAPLCVINDKNLIETADGKLQFLIPDGALPNGVNYTYTVNDVVADDDYTFAHKGMYVVNTQFELPEDFSEDMKQNYITDSSVIYNVLDHEDVEPSQYGLNFVLELAQAESQSPDEVRVTVSIKFDSTSGRNSVLTYRPVFDSSVLSYVGSELPEGMGAGKINAQGIVAAYTENFGLLNDGPLTTFIFKVNEGADITNLPFTVTEVSGIWIAPDPSVIDKSTSYSAAIVLNPSVDTDQYTVTLPPPSGTPSTIQNCEGTPSFSEDVSEEQADSIQLDTEQTSTNDLVDEQADTTPPPIEELVDVPSTVTQTSDQELVNEQTPLNEEIIPIENAVSTSEEILSEEVISSDLIDQ
ncbi:MAG: hypothetical protein HFJ30_06640 [Clostridia bacterium]|nr:hypothetical protein [Clostridia bacterium]MCI9413222.1 hypothetical protein [Clostridia bacterium]